MAHAATMDASEVDLEWVTEQLCSPRMHSEWPANLHRLCAPPMRAARAQPRATHVRARASHALPGRRAGARQALPTSRARRAHTCGAPACACAHLPPVAAGYFLRLHTRALAGKLGNHPRQHDDGDEHEDDEDGDCTTSEGGP